jgi:hypothetical protein
MCIVQHDNVTYRVGLWRKVQIYTVQLFLKGEIHRVLAL